MFGLSIDPRSDQVSRLLMNGFVPVLPRRFFPHLNGMRASLLMRSYAEGKLQLHHRHEPPLLAPSHPVGRLICFTRNVFFRGSKTTVFGHSAFGTYENVVFFAEY